MHEWGGALSVAVVNTAESTVVAGDRQELEEFLAVLEGEGVYCRRIAVDYASHSPQVDPVLESVRSELADLVPGSGDVPVFSTVRGARVDGSELDGDYWADNLREPVRLDLALEDLAAGEETVFLELGAHPLLVGPLGGAGHMAVGSLHRDEDGASRLRQAAAELFAHGIPVEWDTVYAGTGARVVDLPTYAFQHQHYWLELPETSQGEASAFGLDAGEHPLLAGRTDLSDGTVVFTGSTAALARPWNSEHHVFDTALLPTTTLVDLALHAASRVGLERVAETSLEEPIPLDAGPRRLRLVIEPEQDGRRGFTLQSSFVDGPWVRNANGRLAERTTETHPAPDSGPPPGATPLDVEELYASLDDDGHRYGPAFRTITRGWSTGDEVVVEASLPDELRDEAETFGTHPALLEAALAAATRFLPNTDEAIHLPCTVTDAMRHAVGAMTVRTRVTRATEGRLRLALFDPAGDPVATIGAVTTEEVTEPRIRESAGSGATTASSALYHLVGQPVPAPAADTPTGSPTDYLEVDIAASDGSTPDFAALADRVRTAEASTLVVRWPAPDATPTAVHELTHRALAWLRGWLAADALGDTRVVWLTHGAIGNGSAQPPPSPAAGAVWGIARAFQQEHPDRSLVLVDTDTESDRPPALEDLMARLPEDEPQLVLRDGALEALRLLPVERSEEPAATTWNTDGTALITGGTGGLARVLAHHLIAEHGIRHLALVSRSGAAATGSAELVAELETAGAATVTLHACDVSDRSELAEVLDAIPPERPLTAVFHTAAVLDDGLLADLTPERVDTVLRPKIDAAFHLHELTADLPLSAFVLFSSAAGTLGSAGQANYAAANAALDSLAARRRHTGLSAMSLAWGMWTDVGLVTGLDDPLRHRLGRMGGLPITPEFGMRLLDEALGRPETGLAPIPFDHGRLEQRAKEGALPALLRGLVRRRFRRAAGTEAGAGLVERLAGLSESERAAALLDLVRGELATVLRLPEAAAVPADRPVRDLGLDSLMAVESRNRLAALVGEKLPASLLFDHPTPTELSRFLATKIPGTESGGARTDVPTTRRAPDEPIAVVSMAGRYPGGVDSPEGLWRLLVDGCDAVSGFPDRPGWDVAGLFDPDPDAVGRTSTDQGGFLHDAGLFDAGFFGVSPREAERLDPQQRLLLETSWEAIERAGLPPSSLDRSLTGVYLGIQSSGYVLHSGDPDQLDGHVATGVANSTASGRLAYTLGLRGPAVSVDTACSSSLVSIHQAMEALRRGECDLAFAGGVTVMATPVPFIAFSRERLISPDGRCKPFSESADGVGWSEGCGMLLLERLSDARVNGREVLAVLRSSALNQDGRSQGLTAPNGPAQERVIGAALAAGGLEPSDVDAVEAHGTGTALGDPMEANALLATYGQGRDAERPLLVGSIKSNIGHPQAAAGVAGVMKMVLALRHGELPRSLYAEEPTSDVDWSAGPVRLLDEPVSWPVESGRVRRAGVSSFGISGTNAHVILEEAPELEISGSGSSVVDVDGSAGEGSGGSLVDVAVPLVVSGGSGAALRANAGRLAEFLEGCSGVSLADVGLSLGVGRGVFGCRGSVVAASVDGAVSGLRALSEGRGSQRVGMARGLAGVDGVFRADVEELASAFEGVLSRSLLSVMWAEDSAEAGDWADEGSEAGGLLWWTEFAQPALFVVEVALFRRLRRLGVAPGVLVGHSVGELVAVYVAGGLSLVDAARLVAARARLMQGCRADGVMVSVGASEDELRAVLPQGAWLAAVNGPGLCVVSGDAEAVGEVAAHFEGLGRRTRWLSVSHAFHSGHMDPALSELERVAGQCVFGELSVPVVSNVTGQLLTGEEMCSPGYWARHVRQPVRFADGVETALAAGVDVFVECGPDGTASAMAAQCVPDDVATRLIPALRAGGDSSGQLGEAESFVAALGALHTAGHAPDWEVFYHGSGAKPVLLPTYAFQREHYWLDTTPTHGNVRARSADDPLWNALTAGRTEEVTDLLGLPAESRAYLESLVPHVAEWYRDREADAALSDWLYDEHWEATLPTSGTAGAPEGRWLLLAVSEDPVVDATARALEAAGVDIERIAMSTDPAPVVARLESEPWEGALLVGAFAHHEQHDSPALTAELSRVVDLVEAVRRTPTTTGLWCVTRGAVSTGDADPVHHPLQSLVWGLGRVVGLEHPDHLGGLVDVPENLDATALAELPSVLAAHDDEDQLALRPNPAGGVRRMVRRVVRARPPHRRKDLAFEGAVLVTGGTGGLGARTARWLAECARGPLHLVLVSRRGGDAPGVGALRTELAELGVKVTVAGCDVADRGELARLLGGLDEPVRAVFHAAGTSELVPLSQLDAEAIEPQLASKVAGAANLHALLDPEPLEAFVLYGSIAGFWGSGEQGAYAAANAFLDGLSRYRNDRGMAATVLHWGPWAEGGMVTEEADAQLRRRGLEPMAPEAAFRGLELALRGGRPSLVVANVDWSRFAPSFSFARSRPLLHGVAEAELALTENSSTGEPGDESHQHTRLRDAAPEERADVALDIVREEVAAVLGMSGPEAIAVDQSFQEIGLDSLLAVQVQQRLSTVVDQKLSPSLLFDHPTARALAEFLLEIVHPRRDELAEAREAIEVLQRVPAERLEREGLMKQLVGLVFHTDDGAANDETSSDTGTDAGEELFGRLDAQFSKLTDLE
ncbi:type I polyketide synthase [Actinopolyspora alba]|uniref:type I polyketide synthase n=1 Tax=Actinopolyspora alba TaxID=673379 RepID=UPI003183F420